MPIGVSHPMWFSQHGDSSIGPWDLWSYPKQGKVAYEMSRTDPAQWYTNVSAGTLTFFHDTKVTIDGTTANVVILNPNEQGWTSLPSINATHTMVNGTLSNVNNSKSFFTSGLYISDPKSLGSAVYSEQDGVGTQTDYNYELFLAVDVVTIYASDIVNSAFGYYPDNNTPYMPLYKDSKLWGLWLALIAGYDATNDVWRYGDLLSYDVTGAPTKFNFAVPNEEPYYQENLAYTGGTLRIDLFK